MPELPVSYLDFSTWHRQWLQGPEYAKQLAFWRERLGGTGQAVEALPTDLPRPLWVYAGRLAVEKNLPAFLELSLPGSKLVIGDGPARRDLQARFAEAHFIGYRFGEELAAFLSAGDVFVFPSRTDTFGLVMLEAMACGLPVAAFPVTGPLDVVRHGETGCLHEDLRQACLGAQNLSAEACRRCKSSYCTIEATSLEWRLSWTS